MQISMPSNNIVINDLSCLKLFIAIFCPKQETDTVENDITKIKENPSLHTFKSEVWNRM